MYVVVTNNWCLLQCPFCALTLWKKPSKNIMWTINPFASEHLDLGSWTLFLNDNLALEYQVSGPWFLTIFNNSSNYFSNKLKTLCSHTLHDQCARDYEKFAVLTRDIRVCHVLPCMCMGTCEGILYATSTVCLIHKPFSYFFWSKSMNPRVTIFGAQNVKKLIEFMITFPLSKYLYHLKRPKTTKYPTWWVQKFEKKFNTRTQSICANVPMQHWCWHWSVINP